ncbi:hypothetical protein [Micromonospora chersina]|uniref:hypothetical protein n=1 Tax=Micromonospora chersina TaxID=47854 RepID=UPI0036C1E0CD
MIYRWWLGGRPRRTSQVMSRTDAPADHINRDARSAVDQLGGGFYVADRTTR